ncbi:MAG: toxin-antitoxin system YwqK family antitoxin [Vicingaceae bacterium]
MKRLLLSFLFLFPLISFAQIAKETIQIDTLTETIDVVYLPDIQTKFYTKKVAVFANDTAQVAIEKSLNSKGKSGLYKVYYPNGKLKIKTVYALDKLNGEWVYFNENGVIKIKGNYQLGVKHGYWAYKELKIYGRYKDGKKHWKWHKINVNNKKEKSTYKNGVLTRGKGFGGESLKVSPVNNQQELKGNDTIKSFEPISKEYEQAITFLKENLVLKKSLKEYFSKNSLKEVRKLKQYYFRGKFQFVIAPLEMNLSIDGFVIDSKNSKIKVAKIDSVLKINPTKLQQTFSNSLVNKNEALYNNSTKVDSKMMVYFSQLHDNLLRINVAQLKENKEKSELENSFSTLSENQIFEILLYYNDKGILSGAEYEKP